MLCFYTKYTCKHIILYFNFTLEEKIKKVSQKRIKENESVLMELNNSVIDQKCSLFVDLPKEIESKISDMTVNQKVEFLHSIKTKNNK